MRVRWLGVVAAVLLGSAAAFAMPPDIAGVSDALREIEPVGPVAGPASPQIVYCNFSDGTTVLTRGPDDAVKNTSAVCGTEPLGFPKWSGTPDRRDQIMRTLQEMVDPYNIILTLVRPTQGPYTMVLIGPQGNGCAIPGAGGVAGELDCGNRNLSNTAFDFYGSAITIAQEIGHTFGLDHVDVACDVMGASYSRKGCPASAGTWRFPDVTGSIIGGGGCFGTTQNSHRAMLDALGPWPGGDHPDPVTGGPVCQDMAPPTVAITAPADGATVPSPFVVRAEIADDCLILDRIEVALPDLEQSFLASDGTKEWTIDVDDTVSLAITVAATDAHGRETTTTIHVKVDSTPPPEVPDGGGEEDASDDARHDASASGGGDDHGCGYATPRSGTVATGGPTLAMLALALASLTRRRSRQRPGRRPRG